MKNKIQYDMCLDETFNYTTDVGRVSILRVPGGWVYTMMMDFEGALSNSVFVPLYKVKKIHGERL